MSINVFKDSDGDWSSKRIFGGLAIAVWLITCEIVIFRSSDISLNKMEILNNIGLLGTSLLGLGVIEGFSKKKEVKNDNINQPIN